MTLNGWLQIGFFLLAILAVTPVLGRFMTRVFTRERTWLDPVLRPIERLIYRSTGVDETREMRWTEYAASILLFSVVSMLVLYLMQRVQQWLPWNPQGFGAVAPDSAFNTAASFTTNTNWQGYSGESTMSYFTQMAGLAYHNFVSAAVGISIAIAFIRGVAQKEKDTLGNFWVDLTRCLLWVLLPICIVGSLALVSQGVVQNLRPYDKAAVIDPQTVTAPAAPGYAYLNLDEAAFVEALVDHMVPADELTPKGTDIGINVFIDRALGGAWGKGDRLYMQGPWKPGVPSQGYQLPLTPAQLYRAGIEATNAYCGKTYGKTFDRLDEGQREAVLVGLSSAKIIVKHVLPNAMVATLTFLPFIVNSSISTLTSLDFLGLGMPPGSPSLGELLLQGKSNLSAPWIGLSAFVVTALMLSLLIFIGEAVRDAFDPRKTFL